jgi:N-acylneuraminate cytidylyltransferase
VSPKAQGDPASKPLAVIPARGGSSRIPRKNIRSLAGQPLIAYTIAAALESGAFGSVVVSTDSEEIADIARRLGAEVPFMRAASLADDQTPVSAATCDALERLDPSGTRYDMVAQLMPNCPLRTAADIVASHDEFTASAYTAQISVCRYGWLNPWWAMTKEPDGRVEPVFAERMTERSQDQPELYCPTGAIWWAISDVLRTARTFHVPERGGCVLPWEHGLDIDTDDDWRMAEAIIHFGGGE